MFVVLRIDAAVRRIFFPFKKHSLQFAIGIRLIHVRMTGNGSERRYRKTLYRFEFDFQGKPVGIRRKVLPDAPSPIRIRMIIVRFAVRVFGSIHIRRDDRITESEQFARRSLRRIGKPRFQCKTVIGIEMKARKLRYIEAVYTHIGKP